MTETTVFPFSQLDDAPADVEDAPDRRRLAIVLGAAVLAVAVLGGAVFSLLGSDDAGADLPVVPAARAPQAAAAEAPAETAALPVANTESLARSPFEAKYVAPAPAPADQPADVQQAPLQPVVGSDGQPVLVDPGPGYVPPASDGRPASGGAGTAPPPAGSPAAPAPREYALVLASVSVADGIPTATFTIDGVSSTAKATDVFGPSKQLLLRSLQQGPKDGQWTATLQLGDAEPIDVVTGETVYIR